MTNDHSSPAPSISQPTLPYLVRISECFIDIADDIVKELGGVTQKQLGYEYRWIKITDVATMRASAASVFLRWAMPLEHSWPVNPGKADGFVQRATEALFAKFGPRQPQGVFVGTINTGATDRYFKSLSSNLRGRLLQVFPKLRVDEPEDQDPAVASLFCLVGREGLYAGMASPRECNGFYPGGTKFINTSSPTSISRAGAKIAEALHVLRLYRKVPSDGARWLELGAAPGGMTAELLERNYRVSAVDSARMDERVIRHPRLAFFNTPIADFTPSERAQYDAMLCDMNNEPKVAMDHVVRLSKNLVRGGLLIFTLKLANVASVDSAIALVDDVVAQAKASDLRLIAKRHLTYNRIEFTLFFEKA